LQKLFPECSGATSHDNKATPREKLSDTLYQRTNPVKTRSGPKVIAALRNLAISALRLARHPDLTEATRWASRSMDPPFTILGLTS